MTRHHSGKQRLTIMINLQNHQFLPRFYHIWKICDAATAIVSSRFCLGGSQVIQKMLNSFQNLDKETRFKCVTVFKRQLNHAVSGVV
ncbi:hypothetical protein T07_10612 [Trichinella nelsoni]|uniref:Uncharacterized protein n=1 Tax=Trichinella nelsoni TaxID=6336 RepID=A0A0V0RRL9_9BILA|nr:hypothetical protein T07_10612 [Trichinella nelsoni]